MAENGRVHPNCVNASNPYHECGMACLEKIAQGQGQGQKEKKKKLDNHNGIKEVPVRKRKDEQRKVHPNCPKASNPYHECGEYCMKTNGEINAQGVKKLSGSWSFGRKKKGPDSQPASPRVDNLLVGGHHPDGRNSHSEHYSRKKVESENNESFSSAEQYSQEIYPEGHSFNKQQARSPQSPVPASGNVTMMIRSKDPPNKTSPKDLPKESVNSPTDAMPTKHEKEEKLQVSSMVHTDVDENISISPAGSRNFSFLGIPATVEDSEEDEAESVISDSCVSVGKYHVKASVSPILQTIFDRYGDIAANCKLKSNSMRAYYLECLCSVIQELQATSLTQITMAKIKEMLAVLKDVESAEIDVEWLRNILNEISEAIELITKQQTIESAKASCDQLLESTKKELETEMKDLALKERELEEAKARVTGTKARLSELESELSQLEKTIQSARSKVEKFQSKTLADELL